MTRHPGGHLLQQDLIMITEALQPVAFHVNYTEHPAGDLDGNNNSTLNIGVTHTDLQGLAGLWSDCGVHVRDNLGADFGNCFYDSALGNNTYSQSHFQAG